jgi:uncharacterized membrane protein
MLGWILLTTMVLSDAGSDILLSRGTKQVAQAYEDRARSILGIVTRAAQNLSVLGAGILAAIHFGAFLVLLSLWDLSLIIPIAALDYAVVTIGARYLLGEHVSATRWTGVGLIAVGVVITSMT